MKTPKEILEHKSRMHLTRVNHQLRADNAWLQARNTQLGNDSKELEDIKSTRVFKFLRAIGLLK